MKEINDGGQAFPLQHTIADANDPFFKAGNRGMSLRDWFAGQAMIGICLNTKDEESLEHIPIAKAIAIQSYRLADAMLKAREDKNVSTA